MDIDIGAPTWRLCHPVNIYVFRNGVVAEKPQLVHIPMEKKKNMSTVLEAIQDRMKIPVGYPIALYNMDGTRVCKTYELEMYNNYVVVTNLEKRFKCVDYGKVKEPLVVIGADSKHVNTLKFQNKRYDLFCRKKMQRKPLHELVPHGERDGLGPGELPVQKHCGQLCHKILPRRNIPTQCCSDEIMCVEGNGMDLEDEGRCGGQAFGDQELDELCSKVRSVNNKTPAVGGINQTDHNLIDLIQRYKDVGSDIFKMFRDKINKDLQDEEEEIPSRLKLDCGSIISVDTQKQMKEELRKVADIPCQFTFDEFGNFVASDGCTLVSEAGQVMTDGPPDLSSYQVPLKANTSGGSGMGAEGQGPSSRKGSQAQQGEGASSRKGSRANSQPGEPFEVMYQEGSRNEDSRLPSPPFSPPANGYLANYPDPEEEEWLEQMEAERIKSKPSSRRTSKAQSQGQRGSFQGSNKDWGPEQRDQSPSSRKSSRAQSPASRKSSKAQSLGQRSQGSNKGWRPETGPFEEDEEDYF